jgi:hypothetical protein
MTNQLSGPTFKILLPDDNPDLIRSRIMEFCEDSDQLQFIVKKPRFRSIDPPVLVAIIGATSAAIGAFVTGVLAIAKERNLNRISIAIGDTKIEVPESASVEKVGELVELIRAQKNATVVIQLESPK